MRPLTQTYTTFRSFDRPVQVALVNMLINNVGFFMLVPFLAGYMANGLGLALWIVGLVLGIRTFSHQGLSIVGGAIADRIGYKQAIVIGCTLRTLAFILFGFVNDPIGMAAAALLTGIGGALFSPAVKAYVAHEAGQRRVQAFAMLDISSYGGSLLGPLIGALLLGVEFRWVCFGAAGMLVFVTLLQVRYLPKGQGAGGPVPSSMLGAWMEVLKNRPFVLFNLSVAGQFFLYNQVYLGLPLEMQRLTGSESSVGLLFILLAGVGVFGQLPVTTIAQTRFRPMPAIVGGLVTMGLSFVPLLVSASVLPLAPAVVEGWARGLGAPEGLARAIDAPLAMAISLLPLALCCTFMTIGSMLATPFISSTIATLSKGRLVGTYFGIYALAQGVSAALGNLAGGAAFDVARAAGSAGLPWLLMVGVGLGCAGSLFLLDRSGILAAPTAAQSRSEPGAARAASVLAEPGRRPASSR